MNCLYFKIGSIHFYNILSDVSCVAAICSMFIVALVVVILNNVSENLKILLLTNLLFQVVLQGSTRGAECHFHFLLSYKQM